MANMSQSQIEEILADPEFQQRVFREFWDLFVAPEYSRRKLAGELPDNFVLTEYQVILPPDDSAPIVRFNADETKFRAVISLKEGVEEKPVEMIRPGEIALVGNFELIDDDPDCGWIAMLQLAGDWYGYFDFRRNKRLAEKHLVAAQEFLAAARFCHENKYWSAFVDCLFSAAELAAKAQLLSVFTDLRTSKSHQHVHDKYNLWSYSGNVDSEHRDIFNKLSRKRYPARYLSRTLDISDEEASYWLEVVESMMSSID